MGSDFEFTGFNFHRKQLAWIQQEAARLRVSQSEVVRRLLWKAMQPSEAVRLPGWDNALRKELMAWKP